MNIIKNKKVILAIKNMVFVAGLLFIYLNLSSLFELKDSKIKYTPFIEQTQDFDVLFFGTSHVRCGYLPMEMWDKYGIVSYNFGASSPEIATSYWNAMLALEHTNPKLIVFDISRLTANRRVNKVESAHNEFDIFPFSRTKCAAVYDLFKDGSKDAKDVDISGRWSEMLWNFQLYHNRWNELTEEDFAYTPTLEKGATSQYKLAKPVDYELIPREQYNEMDNISTEYLEKLIDECKNRNIQILLTYLPGTLNEAKQLSANYGYEIAKKHNVEFVNFMYLTELLDYNTDFNDTSSTSCHLNVSGAKKTSLYLAEYIQENYQIPNRKENPQYQSWEQDWEEYKLSKKDKLINTDDFHSYLVQAADTDYRITFTIRGGQVLSFDETKLGLMENLSLNQNLTMLHEALSKGENYQFVIDHGAGEVRENTGDAVLYDSCLSRNEYEDAHIEIVVEDNQTNEVVDKSLWAVSGRSVKRK